VLAVLPSLLPQPLVEDQLVDRRVRDREMAAWRKRGAERGHYVTYLFAVFVEMQHRDQQYRDRLAEVEQIAYLRMVENGSRLTDVRGDGRGAPVASSSSTLPDTASGSMSI
jgi:hypothetical protein